MRNEGKKEAYVVKMKEEKLFWSPAVRWKKEEDFIVIEGFKYKGKALNLFPEFYFATQNGIEENDLVKSFKPEDESYARAFVREMLNKNILTKGIISPKEIFYAQSRLFDNKVSETVKFVKEDYEEFKEKQVSRILHKGSLDISLEKDRIEEIFEQRKTVRIFSKKKKVLLKDLSGVLQVLSRRRDGGFFYPSAGGLYPIDVYIYVKRDRVEGLEEGFYYYNPVEHKLSPLELPGGITDEEHFVTNKEIYNSSALTMIFVYNGNCNMPRYDGNGYFFGIIDMGIMVENVCLQCATGILGACSIGDMDFIALEEKMQLKRNHRVLHVVEIGVDAAGEGTED